MSRQQHLRGNIHRDDHHRAVVTDTLPAEVPIVFSNDGFYRNLKTLDSMSPDTRLLVDRILGDSNDGFTMPYRYRVTKDALSTRRLSLLHPRAQVAISDFYKNHAELICYYCDRSEFSIRCPTKVGSSFFFRSPFSAKNKYKGQSIDTLSFEKRIGNPASFFAYRGFDRQHKFFNSPSYVRLEKKFPVMWMGDVTKCFDSIYTHTITWAVKDMAFSKNAIGKASFGDDFDRLMQKMNYNETNGICIGPETSRIFSELILQKIDEQVAAEAAKVDLRHRIDYECVRYVDDIIIFANNDEIASCLYTIFETELGKFNLHLNDSKLSRFKRPFLTDKSWIIRKVSAAVRVLQEQLTSIEKVEQQTHRVPNHIFRPSSVRLSFISEIKAICKLVGVGYDMVTDYVIKSLSNKLEELVVGHEEIPKALKPSLEAYLSCNLLLLELIFFFFTLHPTAKSSFQVAKSMVLAIKFVEANSPRRKPQLIEQLMKWTIELVSSIERSPKKLQIQKVPIEVINIVLPLSQHDSGEHVSQEFLSRTIFRTEEALEYFSTISTLFFLRNKPSYQDVVSSIEGLLLKKFDGEADIQRDSHDAHLLLDVLSCPFLKLSVRVDLVGVVFKHLNIQITSQARLKLIVEEMERSSWFVNWNDIDLLNMIFRKELTNVY